MHPRITHRFPQKDLLLKHQEQRRTFRRLQEDALEEAKRLAELLVKEFGVETVYLAGPLSYEQYQKGMPLELALQGIPEGIYPKALAKLRQNSSFDLALIDLTQADTWTKRSIRKKDRILASKAQKCEALQKS